MTTPGGPNAPDAKSRSAVPAALVEAYRKTLYRCGHGDDAFTLRVGERSEALADLYASTGHQCALFITAHNPFSERQSTEANAAANASLRHELCARAPLVVAVAGVDPTGAWPEEESFLALGIDLESAGALGHRYQQNAVVWAGADAVPRLTLLPKLSSAESSPYCLAT